MAKYTRRSENCQREAENSTSPSRPASCPVIAIIGILAAILIPTISSARSSAEGVQCVSNYSQISKATINYTQINRGCLPKIIQNAIAQVLNVNKTTGEGILYAYYWGGNPVGQVDYFLLHNFTAKTDPPKKADEENGAYKIDFKNSGKLWKCPSIRRDLERAKSGRLGIVYAPHPSKEWSFFNYRDQNRKDTESQERASDVKYGNYRLHAGYDEVPMIAELCNRTRLGDGGESTTPPHNGGYAVAFLDGHVETMDGQRGYLHWCVGCTRPHHDHGRAKYTEQPDGGVKIGSW